MFYLKNISTPNDRVAMHIFLNNPNPSVMAEPYDIEEEYEREWTDFTIDEGEESTWGTELD